MIKQKTREPTKFELSVYKITSKIPRGKTMTYGQIARKLKTSPRAVGQALKRNPFAPRVPCHRVIMSDGSLGGFNGNIKKNIAIKRKMLIQEGALK
jgi:methylated-DNA-[protein]-cysteine S-methyltransferase